MTNINKQIKDAVNELNSLVTKIEKKKELLKDYKDTNDEVQALLQQKKEIDEKIEAILLADVDYYTTKEEIKELEKELNQGAKVATKGTSFKPAIFKAFLKAKLKEDGVETVKTKGANFSYLELASV